MTQNPRDEGKPATANPTERSVERSREDESFAGVIVKRTDETRRHPDDVLEDAVHAGYEQLHRPPLSLALSAVAAGLMLSFTAMAVAVATLETADGSSALVARFAPALVYPLGFVLCIMSGTQLFTEHTATAVYPVLDGRSPVRALLRLWAVVLAGNLIGAAAGAGLLTAADAVVGARGGYVALGRHLVEFGAVPLLMSSLLAGWLMALGGWLVLATLPGLSQIAMVYIVTLLIGIGGLHHSIAGSVEMFTAILASDEFGAGAAVRFIALSVAGNLLGGFFFVAVLNYGHIRRSQALNK